MNDGIVTPASKHVLLALTGGAVVMLAAGGKFTDLTARLRGQPVQQSVTFDPNTLAGWAVLLGMLVFVADIPATAPLAVGFAWLIFMTIMMLYGPEAAKNLVALMGGATPGRESSGTSTAPNLGPRPV